MFLLQGFMHNLRKYNAEVVLSYQVNSIRVTVAVQVRVRVRVILTYEVCSLG